MIGLISINYKIAPVELRERFYFEDSEKLVFNNLLKKNVGVEGLMIISTCNRTEIYFEFENHIGEEKKILHNIIKELVEFKKFKDSLSPYLLYFTQSHEVANHLFRLVSGLESMMVGEFQIVEQLKKAYNYAIRRKMLGPILKRMIQKSLETGKYIRTNTGIDKGAVSVSYAAVEQVTKKYKLSNSKFLCVGLGETSRLVIKHLKQKKISNIKITNRNKNNARKNKLIMVDLSVPRNLPSDLNIEKLEIINIDNLKDVVNENYKKRKKQISKAEEFIDEFLIEFNEWTHSRTLRPSILSIKNDIENGIIEQTLSELNGLKEKNPEEVEIVDRKLNEVVKKYTNSLVRKIKKVSKNGKDEKAIKVINQIFLNE